MTDDHLIPATEDEITHALVFGLRFSGRRRIRYAENDMARIAAEHLATYLRASGLVVMKKPPAPAPRVPDAGP